MYTDDTIITIGKYAFTRICNIPATYLLNLYKHKNVINKHPELKQYIEDNLQRIEKRKNGKPIPLQIVFCEKIPYPTEKDAKYKIKQIRNLDQENKKPVRAYECEKCGAWHLTSISYEEWKKRQVK